jgi:hypothetical protein
MCKTKSNNQVTSGDKNRRGTNKRKTKKLQENSFKSYSEEETLFSTILSLS